MKEALFWLVVIVIFGGVPLSLPSFIRWITESSSERELRKKSEQLRRIAFLKEIKRYIVEILKRAIQVMGSTLKFARYLNPKWITSIILGALVVFSIVRYAPPKIWSSEIFAPIYLLIGIPALIGGPYLVFSKMIYWGIHAGAIAFFSVVIYWLLFQKRANR